MRITEAARRLDTSPRMLRYRDLLGLLPPVREPASARPHADGRQPIRGTGLGRQTAPGDASHPASAGASHPASAGASHPASAGASHPASVGASHPAMPTASRPAPAHRRFGEEDLAAVSLALGIEQRYDISPAALAFGLRVLTEPGVRADVAELARRIGRIGPLPARALEFEKERALRLLSLAPGRRPERPARPDGQRTRSASRPAR
jgi:MerR family transcriptional regulator, copper efflux regulator